MIDEGAADRSVETRAQRSKPVGELGERDSESIMDRPVDGNLVVPAAEVLHERVPGRDCDH